MTTHAVTCRADEPASAAARRMWDHDIGALPVVDETGRAIAMITDRDLAMAAYTQGKPLQDIAVDSAMSRRIFAVQAGADVQKVEHIMQAHQIRRVPVIDNDGRPVGIVSFNDLARHAGGRGAQVSDAEMSRTLRAICQPRTPQAVAAE